MSRSDKYYPTSYQDSRRAFRRRVAELEDNTVEAGEWLMPSLKHDDLYVDHVYLPATEKFERLLVITSGVHGLEAYAGAGVQALFMEEFLPRLERSNTGVWIVHSMNPYGFKFHSRYTENHVNLNRNCSIHPNLFATKNPESVALSQAFIPATKVASTRSHLLQQLNERDGRMFFNEVSLDSLIRTVGVGQYENVAGLEFGGFELEAQTQQFIAGLKNLMPAYRDVIYFDLHTGLGDRGRLHLLTGDEEGCVDPSLFAELFNPDEDRAVYDFTPNETVGFYKTHGATNNLFPELAKPGQRVAGLTMEFGTLGHGKDELLEGLNRWFVEHQGVHYGYTNPALENEVKALYLEKFFPNDERWRTTILEVSRQLFERVMQRAGILAK